MRKFFSILICISCLVCLSCGSSTNGGEVQNKTCTITFHANNGTGITKKQTTGANVYFNLEENTFTYSEHSFNGWNTSENGTGKAYSDKEKTITNINLNLYAQWKDDDIQRVYTAEELINALRHNSFIVNDDLVNILSFDYNTENDFFSAHTRGTFALNNGQIILQRMSGGNSVPFSVSGNPNEIILTAPSACDGEQELFLNTLTRYKMDLSTTKQIKLTKTTPFRELVELTNNLTGSYVLNGDNTKIVNCTELKWTVCETDYPAFYSSEINLTILFHIAECYITKDGSDIIVTIANPEDVTNGFLSIFPSPSRLTKIN